MDAIDMGHRTDKGQKRTGNEDAYIALLPPSTLENVDAVLAVADGMGGHQAGEVASALAVQAVAERLGKGRPAGDPSGYLAVLQNLVEKANSAIVAQAQGERQGMGTTLTLGLLSGGQLHLAHVGDSRAYLLRDGVLQQITPDHSWVAEEVRAGRISAGEAANHPRRNLLTRALGAAPTVDVAVGAVPIQSGDQLLLCSDGLHGVVSDADIAAVLGSAQSAQAACDTLVDRANAAGGPDNITVVVARIGAVAPQKPPADTTATTILPPSETPTILPGPQTQPGRRRWPLLVLLALALLLLGAALYLLLTGPGQELWQGLFG